jgi:hypothetical protein
LTLFDAKVWSNGSFSIPNTRLVFVGSTTAGFLMLADGAGAFGVLTDLGAGDYIADCASGIRIF